MSLDVYGIDFKKPDYAKIFRFRMKVYNQLTASPDKLQTAIQHYKNSPIDFIQDWGITYDPRTKEKYLPFILFPKQKDFILWLLERHNQKEDGIVEKSREVGVSWLCIAFSVWFWLFHTAVAIGFGSRKEMYVDRLGDADSIFEKIRFFLTYLPNFLKPSYTSSFMKIINNNNDSVITGEAGDNIGRGGRKTIQFIDEAAHIERANRVEGALFATSNCKIYCSSVNGQNYFYAKRVSGDFPVFTFRWTDDPRKDKEWYNEKKKNTDPAIFAQEVEIDYLAAVEGIAILPEWVLAAVNLDLLASGSVMAAYDVADEGDDLNAYMVKKGVVVTHVEGWSGKGSDITQSTRKTHYLNKEHSIGIFKYDSEGMGAGVKGEYNSIRKSEGYDKKEAYNILPFAGSDKPSDGEYKDGKKNVDMFVNFRAESLWKLRDRFFRTYQHVNDIKEYPTDDLISIPQHEQLISEISYPKYFFNEGSGKIQIEAKKDMKKRGLKSPNYLDALMMLFAPLKTKSYKIELF